MEAILNKLLEIDPTYISVGLVVAALLLGYLFAYLFARGKRAQVEQELARVEVTLAQCKEQLEQLESTHTQTQEQHRSLELEHNKLAVKHESQRDQLQAAEHQKNQVNEQLARETAQRHEAEKAQRATEIELQENKKQQQSIQTRLESTLNEYRVEREQVSKLKQENADIGKRARAFEVKAEESHKQWEEAKAHANTVIAKLEALQNQYTSLNAEYTELKTSLDERENSHAQQLAQFDEQKKALSEQFKVLANEILDSKSKALQENSKLSLSAIMNPFQQSIDSFKKEVQEIHHRESTQQGELRKELEALKDLNQKITTEAHELSTALRGQKKLQGNWGELVLENVLDRSGLQLGKDYKREVSIETEEGRQRPDAIVYLPQGKHLVIDAKVSLSAYTRYVNAETEAERQQALAEHVKAVSSRINDLASKDYYKLPGLNSPEIVFMFVPIESAFVEALKADETLFQKAIGNNVLVATPTTLLTSLNIVRQLWRYEDQNKHTAALADKAESVFKKLNTFLASFEGVKRGLDKATEAYVKAEGQLLSGRGNLVKQVGEFKNLAPAIKAELPEYFAEKASLEIDYVKSEEQEEESFIAEHSDLFIEDKPGVSED